MNRKISQSLTLISILIFFVFPWITNGLRCFECTEKRKGDGTLIEGDCTLPPQPFGFFTAPRMSIPVECKTECGIYHTFDSKFIFIFLSHFILLVFQRLSINKFPYCYFSDIVPEENILVRECADIQDYCAEKKKEVNPAIPDKFKCKNCATELCNTACTVKSYHVMFLSGLSFVIASIVSNAF